MILNCGAQVDITSISTGGTALAGGIVGQDGFAIVANNYARGSIYAEAGVNSATIGGIAGMQAGVAGNNYADVKLVSKNATGDIGGITGRNTAIGTIIYGYFNKEQEQRSGNSVIAEPKAVGENVTMLGNTGVVKETAGMTAAELRSEAFRDLLNDNQCEDKELRTALAQGISDFDIVVREAKLTIDSWVLDGIVRQGNAPTIPVLQSAAAPVIDPNGGTFTGKQTVTITCATEARASTTRSTAATRRPTARSTPARSRSRSPQRSRPSPSRTAARPARSSRQRSRRTSPPSSLSMWRRTPGTTTPSSGPQMRVSRTARARIISRPI